MPVGEGGRAMCSFELLIVVKSTRYGQVQNQVETSGVYRVGKIELNF